MNQNEKQWFGCDVAGCDEAGVNALIGEAGDLFLCDNHFNADAPWVSNSGGKA